VLGDARKLQGSAAKEVRADRAAIVTFAERARKSGTDRVHLARLSKETGFCDNGVRGNCQACRGFLQGGCSFVELTLSAGGFRC
jgi:hypothetical protein